MQRLASAVVGLILVAGSTLSAGVATGTSLPIFTATEALALGDLSAPPEGVGVIITADFPQEAPLVIDGVAYHAVTVNVTPSEDVITSNVVSDDGTSGPSIEECDDPAFKLEGVTWAAEDMPILWRLNLRSIPDYLEREKTKLTIRAAHRVWPQSKTVCEDEDEIEFRYNYLGHTNKRPAYNETNTIDFGPIESGALAVNSTWYSGTRIREVDLRLNTAYPWTNVDGVRRYQVMNVVSHELGHQFGLNDLGDPHGDLTMYGVIGKREMNKATLGFGDLKGAWATSP